MKRKPERSHASVHSSLRDFWGVTGGAGRGGVAPTRTGDKLCATGSASAGGAVFWVVCCDERLEHRRPRVHYHVPGQAEKRGCRCFLDSGEMLTA